MSDALALAALAHEAQGRAEIAARLLGGAHHLAEASAAGLNRGTWSALPMLGELVAQARLRLADQLGADGLAAHEAAGKVVPVRGLLELALIDLAGDG